MTTTHLPVLDPSTTSTTPSPTTTATTTTTTTSTTTPPSPSTRPVRPSFNSHLTSDRLREGAGLYLPPPFRTDRASNLRKGRTSVFKEMGLESDEDDGGGHDSLVVVVDSSSSPVASPCSPVTSPSI
ncbi:hypothetical protein CP532_2555 [Ophiocordyceps camponoti-leonardi (nom. inval.)]|nr:hypothetical protein CP532_2555 [Ophiocordyceps camponoti-leonardi (nom. inval.)]